MAKRRHNPVLAPDPLLAPLMESESLMARYSDPTLTGSGAAERFALTHWPEPREIEKWDRHQFLLVNGMLWYRIRLDKDGWQIIRTSREWSD